MDNWRERLQKFLNNHHNRVSIEELEPTESPGYWIFKTTCGGKSGGCPHPIHRFLFCEAETKHTISYFDPIRDEKGRWASPYRTWKEAVDNLSR